MHRVIRIVLLLCLAASSWPGIAAGQQSTPSPSPSPSPSAANPEPTPIPLARVPLEAESTIAALQEMNASALKDQSSVEMIATTLATLAAEIDARAADDTRSLAANQSLDTLHRMAQTWNKLSETLSASARELTGIAKNLDQEIERLDQMQKIWQRTVLSA